MKTGKTVKFSALLSLLILMLFAAKRMYTVLGLSAFVPPKDGEAALYMLDTGQSQSVIVYDGETALLIDCGDCEDFSKVMFAANMLGIERFDGIVVSHFHSDHAGGLEGILRGIGAENVYAKAVDCDEISKYSFYFDKLVKIDDGGNIEAGKFEVQFMLSDENKDDLNDSSVVCHIENGEMSALICSDIGYEAELEFINSGKNLSADVMTAGHHGSNYSSCDSFLEKVGAGCILVSVGFDNSYGFPGDEFLNRAEEHGADVYRTDIDSDISVIWSGGEYRVYTLNKRIRT